MKLKKLIKVLNPETIVRLMDADKLDIIAKVKDIPKELKERNVKKLSSSYYDSDDDMLILLKV